MRKLLLLVLLPLAGCVTPGPQARGPSPAERMAADPSNACFKRLSEDAHLIQTLGPKIGFGRGGDPTLEMLADKSKATADEKAAISSLSAARQSCVSLGATYRQANLPPPVNFALEDSARSVSLLLAKLYAGDMTYAEYNSAKMTNQSTMKSRLMDADRQIAQDQAADNYRRQAAAQATIQNMQTQQAIQQQQQIQTQQILQQSRPVNTNCLRLGNQVNCTTY